MHVACGVLNPVQPTNQPLCRMMTDDLAIPLTAVWAAQQLYSSEQLESLQEFTLHLVGAANFEYQHVSGRGPDAAVVVVVVPGKWWCSSPSIAGGPATLPCTTNHPLTLQPTQHPTPRL